MKKRPIESLKTNFLVNRYEHIGLLRSEFAQLLNREELPVLGKDFKDDLKRVRRLLPSLIDLKRSSSGKVIVKVLVLTRLGRIIRKVPVHLDFIFARNEGALRRSINKSIRESGRRCGKNNINKNQVMKEMRREVERMQAVSEMSDFKLFPFCTSFGFVRAGTMLFPEMFRDYFGETKSKTLWEKLESIGYVGDQGIFGLDFPGRMRMDDVNLKRIIPKVTVRRIVIRLLRESRDRSWRYVMTQALIDYIVDLMRGDTHRWKHCAKRKCNKWIYAMKGQDYCPGGKCGNSGWDKERRSYRTKYKSKRRQGKEYNTKLYQQENESQTLE